MGTFSFTDQELADKVVEAARLTWEAGYNHFVHEIRNGLGSKNDFSRLLTLAVDGVAGVGWRLHSVVPYINTVGPNNKEALLTFERPA